MYISLSTSFHSDWLHSDLGSLQKKVIMLQYVSTLVLPFSAIVSVGDSVLDLCGYMSLCVS